MCSSYFRNPHGWFCADLIVVYVNFQGMRQPDKVYLAIIVVYVNFQGMRQPDKVYLAILAFRTFAPSNPIICLFVICL